MKSGIMRLEKCGIWRFGFFRSGNSIFKGKLGDVKCV